MKPDQRDAIEALLERSARDFVPLRRSFLQRRTPGGGAAPLSWFVKREKALDLYLLMHALASSEPWDVLLSTRVWARLLGMDEGTPATGTFISRQWRWLS